MNRIPAVWASLLVAALACGPGTRSVDEESILDFSEIEATLTAQAPGQSVSQTEDSRTQAPAGEAPTDKPAPQPTSPPVSPTPRPQGPTRISFDPGAISASVEGRLESGARDAFVLFALEGQVMNVTASSPGKIVFVAISGASSGVQFVDAGRRNVSWTITLPASQDYTVEAVSGGAPSDYVLTVTVFPVTVSEPDTGDCLAIANETVTAHTIPEPNAEVAALLEPGLIVTAQARTPDGWFGFDPGDPQVGSDDLARLRWVLPLGNAVYLSPACETLDIVIP